MTDFLNRELALREAVHSDSGRVLLQAAAAYMVDLSAQKNANPDWIKGIGMLIHHLNETDRRLDRLRGRSSDL